MLYGRNYEWKLEKAWKQIGGEVKMVGFANGFEEKYEFDVNALQ